MYFTPSILELAGFRNKRTALLVALLPAGVNAAGTVVGALAIDHAGRRWGPCVCCTRVCVCVCWGGAHALVHAW